MTWGEANFGVYSIRRERLKWRIYVLDSDDVTRPAIAGCSFWRWIIAARTAQALNLARIAGAFEATRTLDPMDADFTEVR